MSTVKVQAPHASQMSSKPKKEPILLEHNLEGHTVKDLHALLTTILKKHPEVKDYNITVMCMPVVELVSQMEVDSEVKQLYFIV